MSADLFRDAFAWRTLMELCGSTMDGSQTAVTLSQDDATHTCTVAAGRRSWYGASFVDALRASARPDPL